MRFVLAGTGRLLRSCAIMLRLLVLLVSVASLVSAKTPIVLIVADDLGYGDLSCYGGSTPTPHIDSIARDGVKFTRFYANAPECSPTRTALMTGRYPQRVGGLECAIGTGNVGRYDDAIRLRESNDLGLPVSENTLVRGMNSAGYTTVVSGKWHLGYEDKFLPLKHGFDRSFGPNAGGVDYFHHTEWDGVPRLLENDQSVKREGYMTDLITGFAVQAIRDFAGEPLFLYVPYTAPHTPIQGPDDFKPEPVLKPTWNDGTAEGYAAMLRSLDDGVGRILATLEEVKLAHDALVIFMSDNGGTDLANNGTWRGTKSTLYEGGIHVPCVARWPGRLEPGTVSSQATLTMDFTGSMLRVAGSESAGLLDGIDILAKVEARSEPEPRTLFWRYRRGERTLSAVLDGEDKLVVTQDGDQVGEELFDLATDPGEANDLAASDPKGVSRLRGLLQSWSDEVKAAR